MWYDRRKSFHTVCKDAKILRSNIYRTALRYAGEADDHNQMIINSDTREIKQDLQTSSTNKLALILQKVKVSEDNKLDWILVNNKENKSDIRRVVSKSKEGFRTKKWLVSKEEKGKIRLDKEAITSSNTQQTEWINKKKVITVLQGLRKQNSSWVLDMIQSSLKGIRKNNIDTEITSRREIGRDSYSLEHASLADIVYIDKLERDYIKKQEFGEYCEELLLNQLDRNIKTDQKTLTFYTDSSLLKETRNGRAVNLVKRRPDLYEESSYKLCKDNIEETQDHLACCRAQQTHWQKIKQAAIEAVQALINKPERRRKLRTSELQQCLFGEIYREQKERRKGFTRGLFKNTVIEELINQDLTKREANLALDTTIHHQKLGKRAKLQDKKKVSGKRRREKTEAQKSSDQKSRKPPNSKKAMV
ncbi:2106_t:CDS:2 [Dentiscutata erythropus]|uniref:2106_t:CDS:1 n=1 Tax=Dentiscutata erythropus TaxID=1348616 RepID=A0A9N9FGJ0_9GLOM|nr:2106_t:CDS:2 [Dentiscutata erythropus]